MKQQRTPFMPVTPDIDDDAIESLARGKGVGSLVKPVANRAGKEQPTDVSNSEAAKPTAAQNGKSNTEANQITTTTATPRSRMKALNIELPDYAWTELKIRAAKEQVSVRHIIMAALTQYGVAIAKIDLIEDGRRLRY